MSTQKERADRLADLLVEYDFYSGPTDIERLVDMLTNIRHFCEVNGIGFYQLISMSYPQYTNDKKVSQLTPGQENQLLEAGQDEHQTNKEVVMAKQKLRIEFWEEDDDKPEKETPEQIADRVVGPAIKQMKVMNFALNKVFGKDNQ